MWIEKGPLAWPPRSPDLTPLDFFLGICGECYLPRRQTYNFGGTEGPHHKCSSACDSTNATEHLAGGWIPFRCVQSHPWCTHRVALIILRNSVSFISSHVKVYVNNPLFTLEIITYFSIPLAWTPCKQGDSRRFTGSIGACWGYYFEQLSLITFFPI